jgi:hypothetical protein
VLFRERTEPGDKHAVSYRHRDVHLVNDFWRE